MQEEDDDVLRARMNERRVTATTMTTTKTANKITGFLNMTAMHNGASTSSSSLAQSVCLGTDIVNRFVRLACISELPPRLALYPQPSFSIQMSPPQISDHTFHQA